MYYSSFICHPPTFVHFFNCLQNKLNDFYTVNSLTYIYSCKVFKERLKSPELFKRGLSKQLTSVSRLTLLQYEYMVLKSKWFLSFLPVNHRNEEII